MLNTQEYRDAVAYKGDAPIFTVAYDWQDKPHRLVYDLCDEVDALRAQVAMLTAILRDIADCEDCEGCEHIPSDALAEDAQAWMERQKKRAAADALDAWADNEPVLPGDPPASIAAYFHDDAAAVQCLRAAVVGTLKAAKNRAAQLRKEAEVPRG